MVDRWWTWLPLLEPPGEGAYARCGGTKEASGEEIGAAADGFRRSARRRFRCRRRRVRDVPGRQSRVPGVHAQERRDGSVDRPVIARDKPLEPLHDARGPAELEP